MVELPPIMPEKHWGTQVRGHQRQHEKWYIITGISVIIFVIVTTTTTTTSDLGPLERFETVVVTKVVTTMEEGG